jgi:hypothetical protein
MRDCLEILLHPLCEASFQVLERVVQAAVPVLAFPDQAPDVEGSDERSAVLILPDLNPATILVSAQKRWEGSASP